MKKTFSGMLFMFFLFSLAFMPSAFAAPGASFPKDGSVEVLLEAEGQRLEGGSLSFYHVGKLEGSEQNPKVVLREEYQELGLPLTGLSDPGVIETFQNYTLEKNLSGTTIPVKNGRATLEIPKEALGIYLVVQQEACAGYETSNPFFVTVPKIHDGVCQYHMVCRLKMGIPEKLPEEVPDNPPNRVPGDLEDEFGDGTEQDENHGSLEGEKPNPGRLPQTGMQHEVLAGILIVIGLGCLFGAFRSKRSKAGR